MEDGVKGNSNTSTASRVTFKAGWLKKSSGLLGLWKDRYILLLKTKLLVCESEDEQKCLETLELSSYERCQDQRAFLKRKRHFTLIPSPGTKVQDVKFLARNAEERDTWIQALNDGINRGKNTILDEVKVDPTISLEHVTRDRARMGAAKRRPPTRIHLKEVAEAAEDDSLRLGLDTLKTEVLTVIPREPEERVLQPQKEPVKIPMPPSKPSSSISAEMHQQDNSEGVSEIPHPPSPPPKTAKEGIYAREKFLSEAEERKHEIKTPNSGSQENLVEAIYTPPKPPPKILSDRMKIKWMGSSSDMLETESMKSHDNGSKENLVEFETDEPETSHSPVLQAFEEKEAEAPVIEHSVSNVEGERLEVPNDVVNKDLTDGDSLNEPSREDKEEETNTKSETKDQLEVSDVQATETYEKVESLPNEGSDEDTHSPKVEGSRIPDTKPRSSSMGNLLCEFSMDSESKTMQKSHLLHVTKDHFHEVEMKLSRGRKTTESLLNQVLQGQLVKSPEANGPDINAETLLHEAVKQLREASMVLQEIKESSNASDIPEAVTDNQKEKTKELLTLYRRSVP
ncbi:pleckstrin homology domain-containing family O member 2 [Spea bombifrons]|uniref:pleckstrin homology domain-containing family O member 2 n=1 Tax=Spea bombifrons TaxID=233779 RepID=UPI00234B88E4|nr:pleckstrin homology domain-containing family O member 2 [Spea bombifrons]